MLLGYHRRRWEVGRKETVVRMQYMREEIKKNLKTILEITQLSPNYLVRRSKCKVESLMKLTSTQCSEIGLSLMQ